MAPTNYEKANPAPPNRLPLPPPRRTAEGMRCCGSGTGAASTQQRHESVPKRNVRQPTHCTRTACRHSRPEGQPGACGAAGALWDDKRTGTLTTLRPQRTSRRPEEKHPRPAQSQIKHAHARAACCAARVWHASWARGVGTHPTQCRARPPRAQRDKCSKAHQKNQQGQHIARATWHQPTTKKPTPRPRTACHYRRPEGQRRACGAAGAGAAPRERPKKQRPAANPLHPNRLPPQPPRRTARSMRCCGCTMG